MAEILVNGQSCLKAGDVLVYSFWGYLISSLKPWKKLPVIWDGARDGWGELAHKTNYGFKF